MIRLDRTARYERYAKKERGLFRQEVVIRYRFEAEDYKSDQWRIPESHDALMDYQRSLPCLLPDAKCGSRQWWAYKDRFYVLESEVHVLPDEAVGLIIECHKKHPNR